MVVTVLMSVRDTPAALLGQAIESILSQTFADFDFLILDDGSRDSETLACLRSWAGRDARIRLESGPARGLTPTLNIGLERAKGIWIARQDADDWSEPDRLQRQLAYVQANPECVLCGTAAWTHQQTGVPLWRTRPPLTHAQLQAAFWKENPFVHGSSLYRRERALAIGAYREAFPCGQDYDFFWRLSEAGQAVNLPEPLYHYRYFAGAVTARRAAEQEQVRCAARILAAQRQCGQPEDMAGALAEAEAAVVPAETLRALLKQVDHILLAGDYARAWREYRGLLRTHPWSRLAWVKLARCGVFAQLPLAREACFR